MDRTPEVPSTHGTIDTIVEASQGAKSPLINTHNDNQT